MDQPTLSMIETLDARQEGIPALDPIRSCNALIFRNSEGQLMIRTGDPDAYEYYSILNTDALNNAVALWRKNIEGQMTAQYIKEAVY